MWCEMTIENLKIGCTVSKDQVIRFFTEDIDADDILEAIDFDAWFVEYIQDGQLMHEEFECERAATDRYNELKTLVEYDAMKGLLGNIGDWAKWRGVIENG